MIIAVIVFAVAMIIGVPVAFALGLMGSVHVVSLGNPSYYLVIIQRLIDQVNMTSLTCLPFFILAGELMNGGGVTRRLLDFLRSLLGWLKGGLAYCTVVIAAILSAILGSPNGVASMLCGILVPFLENTFDLRDIHVHADPDFEKDKTEWAAEVFCAIRPITFIRIAFRHRKPLRRLYELFK